MTVASSIGGGNNRWLGCVVGLILLWLGCITIKLMHHGQGSIVCNSLLIPCTMNFYSYSYLSYTTIRGVGLALVGVGTRHNRLAARSTPLLATILSVTLAQFVQPCRVALSRLL